MATLVYPIKIVYTVDDQPVEISPLKIKYLREFMDMFDNIKNANTDDDVLVIISKCVSISMKQFNPKLIDADEYFDLNAMYQIVDIAAGIKLKPDADESLKSQAEKGETWDTLDLAKIEGEIFALGIWKNYEELETSMSMKEIVNTLQVKRELDYQDKKFDAAIQGVDLDKNSKSSGNEWEDLKARAFSKGMAKDGADILSLQGINAVQAGFGIGLGLDYESN